MRLNMDSLASEVAVAFFLLLTYCYLDTAEPFHREIQPDELWLYKNPHKPDTFSSTLTVVLSFGTSPVIMASCCLLRGLGASDLVPSVLAVTLSGLLTSVLNNIVKLLVGRPRPDFYQRCFPKPTGEVIPVNAWGALKLDCTGGDANLLRDGRKSFPSGHSALICSTFVFLSVYLIGQLGVFLPRGRGQAWRICVCLLPSLFALLVCLSRYSDYRHHWQDVLVGGTLGSVVAWLMYHQYFPALGHQQAHRPLAVILTGNGSTGSISNGSFSSEHRFKPDMQI